MKGEKLRKTVNSSGFPLQIGIEHEVEKTHGKHGWCVLSSEHSWYDKPGQKSGFVDLILEHCDKPDYKLIVECKRVQDTSWVFLSPKSSTARRHIKAWTAHKTAGRFAVLDWYDVTGEPATVESKFCVVHGQDPKARPMLEKIAAELILATESFGREDVSYCEDIEAYTRILVPVIVTTAELKICSFFPDKISTDNGELNEAEFETVPYLRFRKQLSNRIIECPTEYPRYREISGAKENTVFVVNSSHLVDLLKNYEIDAQVRYNLCRTPP